MLCHFLAGEESQLHASHYATLNLTPGASLQDIRRAYRLRAKQLHPDINRDANAGAEFQRLQHAYRMLSESALHHNGWNHSHAESPRPASPPPSTRRLRPLRCTACHKPTAQPRHAIYSATFSYLLFCTHRRKEGLFCASCSRSAAFRASLASSFFGWWSLPGLVATPMAIFINARGGDHSSSEDISLLWHSAIIFHSRGDAQLARSLAQQVALSSGPFARLGRSMVAQIDHEQPTIRKARIVDPWRANRRDWWKHASLAALVPSLLSAAAVANQPAIDREMSRLSEVSRNYVDTRFPGVRTDTERRAHDAYRRLLGTS